VLVALELAVADRVMPLLPMVVGPVMMALVPATKAGTMALRLAVANRKMVELVIVGEDRVMAALA